MLDSNKIISNLLSEDNDLIKSTISEIKSEGDMSIVPLLFEVLENPELNHSAEGAIATLLAEIKDPAFIPMLNEEINNLTDHPEAQAKLVRVCWESTMDFSTMLPLLCDLAVKGSFVVAMEATTAIEEQIRFANHDMLHELRESLLNSSQENSLFAEDILASIENALSNIHSHHEEHDDDCDCPECMA